LGWTPRRIKRNMKIKLRVSHILLLIAVVISLFLGGVFLVYLQERSVRPEIDFFDVLENAVIVIMGEYPDKPRSAVARIFQLFLLILGALLFGTVIGKISSLFVAHTLKKRRKMKKYHNHIIICNWNKNAESIIRQLIGSHLDTKLDVLVISPELIEDDALFEEFENLHFTQRDPTQHNTLLELNAHKAKSIILLADMSSESPDDKNALIALAIKHLEKDKNIDVHVVAELVKFERKRHLMEAGVDEVVCSMGFTAGIIAQSALFKNMSEVYERLLSYSTETNEIYFIQPHQYPAEFVGKNFFALSTMINERRKDNDENPVLLLGIKHKGEIILNPKKDNFSQLDKDDSLIVMAFSNIEKI
jgi:voltage-gated potassium channel